MPNLAVLNVNGVGYSVHIPISTYEALPPMGNRVKILTHLVVREDDHLLYGFATEPERDLFRLLILHVSGVGPKVACAVLSGMPVGMFRAAVAEGNVVALSRINGVGKKTSERIILELKDKLGIAAAWQASAATAAVHGPEQRFNDAVLGLVTLGYRQPEAIKAVREAVKTLGEDGDSEALLRAALRKLV